MIRFIVTDPTVGASVDTDITDVVMDCDKLHETIIDDTGMFEWPELSITCDNSESWARYYIDNIQADRLYLYVFDDRTLLYAGLFRTVIPAYDYANQTVQFFTDSLLQTFKRSFDTLFFSQSDLYKNIVQLAPYGGFEAFTKLGYTRYPATFNIGSFSKTVKDIYLRSDYSDGNSNTLTIWGDVLRAAACTYIWCNGYYRVQSLGGVLYEVATETPTNITDDILEISTSEPWNKSKIGVIVAAGNNKYRSDYGADNDDEVTNVSASALNYMWYQNGTDRDSFEDAYYPLVNKQYTAYFCNPAGDGIPQARIAYNVEVDGLDYYCGMPVTIDDFPDRYFVDELYKDLKNRTTELKIVSA